MPKAKVCRFKKCRLELYCSGYCKFHYRKADLTRFLRQSYHNMKWRTRGVTTRDPHLYIGKPVMSLDDFLNWAKNDANLLFLYKNWVASGFNNKLTPSPNRIVASDGYVLGNVEWVTNSTNAKLGGALGLKTRKSKTRIKQEVYKLLGVKSAV